MVLASPPAARPSRSGEGDGPADAYEETHVHGVYEAIASHFSATRHKPWPFVSSFLASRPPGSVGLDIGCGNGKNMGVNQHVAMLGCDRSAALVALARDSMCTARYRKQPDEGKAPDAEAGPGLGGVIAGADAVAADSLALPFREASADFVICIAVIHHLSTRERRVDAIRQLLRCVRRGHRRGNTSTGTASQPHDVHHAEGAADVHGGGQGQGPGSSAGQVLVYVWALEQSSSRRGWAEGGEQDLLVPWVMKAPQQKKARVKGQQKQGQRQKQNKGGPAEEAKRQHVDRATDERRGASGGEGGDGTADGGRQQQQQQGQQQEQQQHDAQHEAVAADATADPGTTENDVADGNSQQEAHTDKTFHRYYHLYREGELEEEVVAAGGSVLSSGYERDNWWVIAG